MNRYKESIEAIKSNYPPENYTILREGLDVAIEVLEKQIPKDTKETQELMTIEYICPECDCTNAKHFNYCWHCGQAIINN